VWPADPRDPRTVNETLYAGNPGIVLCFLELHGATGEAEWLRLARGGADHLVTAIETEKDSGLYEGVAGIGFALVETWRATRDARYRDAALRVVERLKRTVEPTGTWNETTDVISGSAGTGLFLLYAALNGVTLSRVFYMYSHADITGAFLITSGMFGATSFYGMVTRRDLSSLGSLLFMALLGLIIASIVNVFMASSALYWLISYAGVAIFVGLTAYDTQKLRELAYATAGDSRLAARLAVNGSLALYLDFINLLLFILRIMGSKRR
jgi:FtsH-binding integral membrane protein